MGPAETLSGVEALKRAAAVRAAEWIEDGMVLGLGTGSTIRHLLNHIAQERRAGRWQSIAAIPTSHDTESRARELGIPLVTFDEQPELDLTIDGADEVDPELNLIKGLGGALLREKIVAAASHRLVIAVDETKLVLRLGSRAPLPVEVDPFALPVLRRLLAGLGADARIRRTADGTPLVTDGGHRIIDCRFEEGLPDPAGLDAFLHARPGVIETGLFLGMTHAVVAAGEGGVRVLERTADRGVAP